jgi:hypothetical protein
MMMVDEEGDVLYDDVMRWSEWWGIRKDMQVVGCVEWWWWMRKGMCYMMMLWDGVNDGGWLMYTNEVGWIIVTEEEGHVLHEAVRYVVWMLKGMYYTWCNEEVGCVEWCEHDDGGWGRTCTVIHDVIRFVDDWCNEVGWIIDTEEEGHVLHDAIRYVVLKLIKEGGCITHDVMR